MQHKSLRKILIVDDDDDVRTIASMALELTGGFIVENASSGRDAIAKSISFHPDIILLDFVMPGMDGPETLRSFQSDSKLSHIPVVFMTGKVEQEDVARCLSLGACSVISKPFEAMLLAGQLQDIWKANLSRLACRIE